MRVFDYKYKTILQEFCTVIGGVAIAFFLKRKEMDSAAFFIIFGAAFFGYKLILHLFILARITLDEDEIRIDYLFSIRRSRRYAFEDIEGYGGGTIDTKLVKTKRPIMGALKPKGEKAVILWYSGTKEFEKLHEALSNLFPRILREGGESESG